MLTKEQANLIADEALAQQRSEHLELRNRRARRVSWPYRVPGLVSRQPFEQAELLDAAERLVARSVTFWTAEAGWLILAATIWHWETPRGPGYGVLAGIVLATGMRLIHIPFVRRQLAKLVGAVESKSRDAS
jgi:hypothetical protein